MNYDDAFTPETAEEQIDQHTLSPAHLPLSPNAHVIQELQAYYKEDQRSATRMWERLLKQVSELESNAQPPEPSQRWQKEGIHAMPQLLNTSAPERPHKRNTSRRSLSLLVAAILTVLLVGSLAMVLELSHQKPSSQTASSTPGQVIYSGPQENGWLSTPVWSADSQLLAASSNSTITTGSTITIDAKTEIWDAITGQHKLTIPLAGTLAWSPKGDLLAIASLYSITVVNGKTGETVSTYKYPAPTYPNPPVPGTATPTLTPTPFVSRTGFATGSTPLVSRLPLSGGTGIGGFAWSPDGQWIVSTYSYATADGTGVAKGEVEVWNAQTGHLAYTLATEPGYKMDTGVSWSPDGQYIAANMGKFNGENTQLNVWSVQKRQVVFQQTIASNQGFVSSSWQPGTNNLAAALIVPGSDSSATNSGTPGSVPTTIPTTAPTYSSLVLKIWNVTTGQLLKSYPSTFPGIDELSWSPNGQEIVYSSSDFAAPPATAALIILDVNSGQKVYTYQVSDPAAQTISLSGSWSPDGKYIASVENVQTDIGRQKYIVKVWIAQVSR